MEIAGNLTVTNEEAAAQRKGLTVGVFHDQKHGRSKRASGDFLGALSEHHSGFEEKQSGQAHNTQGYCFRLLHLVVLSVAQR